MITRGFRRYSEMYSDIPIYEGFSCEAIGRVKGGVTVNAYVTINTVKGGDDVIDFYLISFTMTTRSEVLNKNYATDRYKRVVSQEKHRVVLYARNIDFVYVMKPGAIIHVKGKPKISDSVRMRYGNPLYISASSYQVMRIPDVVDKDTGEVISSVEDYLEPPVISYFIRTVDANGITPYRKAPQGYEPNNMNKKDRIKNENLDADEFEEDWD